MDKEKALDFYISTPLRDCKSLMDKIPLDDMSFTTMRFSHTSIDCSKNIYIYGVARQILKACTWMLQYQDILSQKPEENLSEDGDLIFKYMIEAIIDAQHTLIRKLQEILINLIILKKLKIDNLFRILLNAENLDLFLSERSDMLKFYEIESTKTNLMVEEYSNRIINDLYGIEEETSLFLDKSKLHKKIPSIFKSVRSRLIEAQNYCSAGERLVIGKTYHTYSRLSISVHPEIGSHIAETTFEQAESGISNISMFCFYILENLYELAGYEYEESITKTLGKKSHAPHILAVDTKNFEIGDIVYANKQIGEIIECKKSTFGYTSFRIKFLMSKNSDNRDEDWYRSMYVNQIVSRKNIRVQVRKWLLTGAYPIEKNIVLKMLDMSDDELFEALKRAFVNTEKIIPLNSFYNFTSPTSS